MLDEDARHILVALIKNSRTAALGTLRNGAPEVSVVLIAESPALDAFYFHISRLAHHTQNIMHDSRVSLMLAESDDGTRNPQTLARVSLQGEAVLLDESSPEYESARASYVQKFPSAEMNFGFSDFRLYKVETVSARFVAGFGQIYTLTHEDFKKAADST